MHNSIAIALIPRDRFSTANLALQAICQTCPQDVHVYVIDCGYTETMLGKLNRILAESGLKSTIVPSGNYLLANESLNRLTAVVREEILCVVENDVIVRTGFLQSMYGTLSRHASEFVQPLVSEGDKIHYDPPHTLLREEQDGLVSEVVRNPRQGYDRVHGERQIYHIEKHCFLVKTAALRSIGPFEDFLVTRSHHDLSIRAFKAGHKIAMCPGAVVDFITPKRPISAEDLEFFMWRWDLEKASVSNKYVQEKWNIKEYKPSIDFVEEMVSLYSDEEQ